MKIEGAVTAMISEYPFKLAWITECTLCSVPLVFGPRIWRKFRSRGLERVVSSETETFEPRDRDENETETRTRPRRDRDPKNEVSRRDQVSRPPTLPWTFSSSVILIVNCNQMAAFVFIQNVQLSIVHCVSN